MSTNESTVAASAVGESLKAIGDHVMAVNRATEVAYLIEPIRPAGDNPATTGACTSGGATSTTSGCPCIDEMDAGLKDKTGGSGTLSSNTPNHPSNNNN